MELNYLHWYWNVGHDPALKYYEFFTPLSSFMSEIDFEWNNWEPHTNAIQDPNGNWTVEPENVEHYYMTNFDRTQVMGWFHNRSAYWANETPDCYIPIYQNGVQVGSVDCPPDDTLCDGFISPVSQQTLIFNNFLNPGEYHLQYFDTYTGETVDDIAYVLYDGYIYFDTRELNEDKPDYAYKLWPISETSFRNNDQAYLRDTAVCVGEHFLPYHLLHNFTDSNIVVSWIFSGSSPLNEYVAYIPGVYSIMAIMNNHGEIDTLKSRIFIKDCQPIPHLEQGSESNSAYWIELEKAALAQQNRVINTAINEPDLPQFKVYPVPARNSIFIESMNNETNWEYEIIDITGSLILKDVSKTSRKIIDVSEYAQGMYLMSVHTASQNSYLCKIIVE